jgi:hypothetical protein
MSSALTGDVLLTPESAVWVEEAFFCLVTLFSSSSAFSFFGRSK